MARHQPLNLRLQVAHRLLLDPPRLLIHPLFLSDLGARLAQRLHPPQFGGVPLLGVAQTLLTLPLHVLQVEVQHVAALAQPALVLNELGDNSTFLERLSAFQAIIGANFWAENRHSMGNFALYDGWGYFLSYFGRL